MVGQNPKAGGQKYAFHIPKGQGYRGDKEFVEKVLPPKLLNEVCTVKSIVIKLCNMSHQNLRNRSLD